MNQTCEKNQMLGSRLGRKDASANNAPVRSAIFKRSIVVAGHKTSVSLEAAFWASLREIAVLQRTTLSGLVGAIDTRRTHGNLSSAIRLFVLEHYQSRTGPQENCPPSAAADMSVG
jgi:predicted DNA-binding ribbon-helix-helix protein